MGFVIGHFAAYLIRTRLGNSGFRLTPSTGAQFFFNSPRHDRDHDHHHRRSHDSFPFSGGLYAVPITVPYAADMASDTADDDDANYQGGPTIFDRRGPGPEAYIPPVQNPQPARATQSDSSDPVPETPQPATMLVFKDGHQLEVENYAIVGPTLFDLTPGHSRKVPLASLDLEATEKLNDDRGVNFQLPPTA